MATDFHVWGTRRQDWSAGLMFVGGITLLGAAAMLAWQAFAWLKTGDWPAIPIMSLWVYAGLPPPSLDWVGAEKIALWVLDQSLGVLVWLTGIGMIYLAVVIED